ncbi:MAG: hypothetical protein UY72_C0077G0009 [Candidatus Uhrbacteria bacterium GW2011_GWD2_52_7]|uniref:EfeO-type cupredoxin-like domain-containing protein n=1 Tax=Candidatus Uhrbacteria bacterium GW2011_GWD2_52_7 TaxID=1618989 RepID=A0A0G1XBN6_9BACT|nr:MAG: hypothetical protein UY72_C0077G0009 [Candidatus Uhrbacteria bacterium GW2011_GWD2_52_7]
MAYRYVLAVFVLMMMLGAGCASDDTVVIEVNEEVVADIVSEQITKTEAPPVEIVADVSVEVASDILLEASGDAAVVVEEPLAPLLVSLEAGNFFLSETEIIAKPGQDVVITFSRVDGSHTFVIEELGINKTITAGGSVAFTAPTTPGQYVYFCDVGGHQKLGMEGKFIVEE